MNHRSRLAAAVAGEATDRLPVALWRHFPGTDLTADDLAAAVVAFQRRYDFDLVKVTPASGRMAEAWGARLVPADNDEGTRRYLERPVSSPEDWPDLPPLSVEDGVLGEDLKAMDLIRAALGPDTPVVQTVFSPLAVARQLAGDAVLQHLRDHPRELESGLGRIAEAVAAFALASVDHGADGVFFAAQLARRDLLTPEEYARFGEPFDRMVLDSVPATAWPAVLHLHGTESMFELAQSYPCHIVNWHDRETAPSLAEGSRLFQRGAVLGGLARHMLGTATPDEVRAQAEDAVAQTGGRGMILGTGCVTFVTTPEANLEAVRQVVEGSAARGGR